MITSVEVTSILEEATVLSEYIRSSELAAHYQQCRDRLSADPAAQQLIQRFIRKKEMFEEVRRFGKYHPDFKSVQREVRELKREVDLYGPIADFKKAEKEMDELLAEISGLLAVAVSENMKVPTGNPFFDATGCGGRGCGSGGCGCGK